MTRSCSLIALGLVAVLSSSCAEDSSGSPARDGTTPDAATGPPAPRFVEGPTIENNPNPVPLAAVVRLRTDVPTRARIEIGDGRTVAFRQLATSHVLPVLGLQPGTTYSIKVSISNERGVEVEAPAALPFTTVPLPGDFPPITATVVQPDKVEPGVVVFSPARASQPPRYVVGVDEAGKVVWYYEGLQGAVVRPLASGNLLLVAGGKGVMIEIDTLGKTLHEWRAETTGSGAISVPVTPFHHDVLELPSGNLLVLSRETRELGDYPTSDTDPNAPKASATVIGDVVVEFRPDGTIVNQWSLFDLLDPYRIGYDSITAIVQNDWSHANGLAYSAGDDAIIVSVRHQDVVCKFSRQTGKLLWLLGPHANWKPPWSGHLLAPQGGLEWPYHIHSPVLTPDGELLLFDNGNQRASPFDAALPVPERYSRAVAYSIDEAKMEVTEVWSYGGPGDEWFYSKAMSGVSWLPKTGNVLVTDGNRVEDDAGKPTVDPGASFWARIVEVTRTKPATKVFELEIRENIPGRWTIYRGHKMPGLYPAALVQ